MVTDDPTDRDEHETDEHGIDEHDRTKPGRLDRLRSLLEKLDERGKIERPGSIESERGIIDVRYSIMSGFDNASSVDDLEERSPVRRRQRRSQPVDSDDYLVTTRQEGDEFVVVADLTGVRTENLSVGLDERTESLVIGVDDRAVEQVPLPEGSTVTHASFSNQILEVRMRPIEEGDDPTEHGGSE